MLWNSQGMYRPQPEPSNLLCFPVVLELIICKEKKLWKRYSSEVSAWSCPHTGMSKVLPPHSVISENSSSCNGGRQRLWMVANSYQTSSEMRRTLSPQPASRKKRQLPADRETSLPMAGNNTVEKEKCPEKLKAPKADLEKWHQSKIRTE